MTNEDLSRLSFAQRRDLVVAVEVEQGVATGTVGELTDEVLGVDFNTGSSFSVPLDDVWGVSVLGAQLAETKGET